MTKIVLYGGLVMLGLWFFIGKFTLPILLFGVGAGCLYAVYRSLKS